MRTSSSSSTIASAIASFRVTLLRILTSDSAPGRDRPSGIAGIGCRRRRPKHVRQTARFVAMVAGTGRPCPRRRALRPTGRRPHDEPAGSRPADAAAQDFGVSARAGCLPGRDLRRSEGDAVPVAAGSAGHERRHQGHHPRAVDQAAGGDQGALRPRGLRPGADEHACGEVGSRQQRKGADQRRSRSLRSSWSDTSTTRRIRRSR